MQKKVSNAACKKVSNAACFQQTWFERKTCMCGNVRYQWSPAMDCFFLSSFYDHPNFCWWTCMLVVELQWLLSWWMTSQVDRAELKCLFVVDFSDVIIGRGPIYSDYMSLSLRRNDSYRMSSKDGTETDIFWRIDVTHAWRELHAKNSRSLNQKPAVP